jgi:hypothetical protein
MRVAITQRGRGVVVTVGTTTITVGLSLTVGTTIIPVVGVKSGNKVKLDEQAVRNKREIIRYNLIQLPFREVNSSGLISSWGVSLLLAQPLVRFAVI